jgi:hypothetical protein
MVGLKTASLIVLLNLFSLNARVCHADAFYDSLKATGKTDSTTTSTVRGNTVDSARRSQMNAITQNNPDYVAPSKLPSTPTYSDADLEKMKDEESNQLETPDDISDKQIAAKLKKEAGNDDLPLTPGLGTSSKSGLNANISPTRGRGPTLPVQLSSGAPIKVTNTDPDEVTFPGDAGTPKPAKKNRH